MKSLVATICPEALTRLFSVNKPVTFQWEFDSEATKEAVFSHILDARRDRLISAEKARDYWDTMSVVFSQMYQFSESEQRSAIFFDQFPNKWEFDIAQEFVCTKPSDAYEFCKNTIVPFFQQYFQEKQDERVGVEDCESAQED